MAPQEAKHRTTTCPAAPLLGTCPTDVTTHLAHTIHTVLTETQGAAAKCWSHPNAHPQVNGRVNCGPATHQNVTATKEALMLAASRVGLETCPVNAAKQRAHRRDSTCTEHGSVVPGVGRGTVSFQEDDNVLKAVR